ncbi:MAG TPA: hypothetical protein VFV72_05355 [Candidatus Limnocylindrales bacterium]|nr:hypothetical protein [Candidatus Limnocylindrales bacterium]
MTSSSPSIVDLVREHRLDADLAALLWALAQHRVAVHVVPNAGAPLAKAVRELAAEPALVTDGPGSAIEEVLRQPVPLRPPTGAVVVTDIDGRVASAHLIRPPLRDGAGHVRPQPPGVLAARLEAEDRLEHFAWGVMPEIAADLGILGGELDAEVADRTSFLAALAATGPADPEATRSALRAWHRHAGRSH